MATKSTAPPIRNHGQYWVNVALSCPVNPCTDDPYKADDRVVPPV
jgi:hypothetical protein